MTAKETRYTFQAVGACLSRQTDIVYKGEVLDNKNSKIVKECYAIWICDLFELLNVRPKTPQYGRGMKLLQLVLQADVFAWMSALDALNDCLMSHLNDDDESIACYKQAVVSFGLGEIVTLLLSLLRGVLTDWIQYRNPDAFSRLRECFVCINRMPLKHDDLRQAAFEKWIATESEPVVQDELAVENALIRQWFPRYLWPFEELYPQHGNGRTAEVPRPSIGRKARFMNNDERLTAFYKACGFPVGEGLMADAWAATCNGCGSTADVQLFVPKNWKLYRGISCQPTVRLFAQQAVREWVYRYCSDPRNEIHRYYDPYSTDISQQLTLKGSRDGSYTTIDMSSASDSNTYEHCLKMWRGSCLLMPMMLTRSTTVRYEQDGTWKTKEYRMFAPMGSATCFPALSINVCAIAVGIVRQFPGRDQTVRVYGDDLIVPTYAAPYVMQRFRDLGWKINETKSFYNPFTWSRSPLRQVFFRESCGIEALNGFDVTPFRIPRKFPGLPEQGKYNPRQVASAISMCNNAYERYVVRRYILARLSDARVPVLFDADGSKGIKSSCPNNRHLPWSENFDLQRLEVEAWCLTNERHQDPPNLGQLHLFEQLRTYEMRRRSQLLYPEDRIDSTVTVDPFEVTASKRWFAVDEEGVPL